MTALWSNTMRQNGILEGRDVLSTEVGEGIPKARAATVRVVADFIVLQYNTIVQTYLGGDDI